MADNADDAREASRGEPDDPLASSVIDGARSTRVATFVASSPSRRQVLRGVAATGALAATGLLAACGGDDDSASGSGSTPTTSAATEPSEPTESETESPPGGTALAKTSDIPVGGGRIFDAEKVVVTQPTQGDFKGFSAVCTHQGCLVSGISDGIISCPCHGSRYSITDGSVQNGPATQPLPAKTINVEGSEILLA